MVEKKQAKQEKEKLRIAATADIHVRETSKGMYKDLFADMSEDADIVLLCGDLTDFGKPEEAEVLASELQHCNVPILAVLGNHDYHNNLQRSVIHILQESNVNFVHSIEYIHEKNEKKYGFTGAKGFGGGFKPSMWGRFGEPEQKAFYDAIEKEVETLENGLIRLNRSNEVDKKIVLTHFSPTRSTLEGELPELYPFLGSTRLEEIVDRYDVDMVFHGHAHFGSPQGKTEKGIPVYNVAFPLMKKISPDKPYCVVDI